MAGLVSVAVAAGGLIAVSAPASAAPATSPATALYAWGYGEYGQLGDGLPTISSSMSSPVPVLVPLPAGVAVTAASEGQFTSLAVGSDGNIYAWGDNEFGQLGDGSTQDSSTPVQVSLPGGVTATAVSEGENTSLALGSDGTIYAWGDNGVGEFGDGSTQSSSTPVQVSLPGGVTATAVSEGNQTSLALGSDGNVYAWGNNTDGQLGDGSTENSSTPVRVSLPAGVTATAVSEGQQTSLAVGSDGNVYAWGYNLYQQLGEGSTDLSLTPVQVPIPGGPTATAVAEGYYTSLAITRGGTGPVSTVTSLTASPNPTTAGATVTLTASVSAADGSSPVGSVQFEDSLFAIGPPVAVNASGVASTTMTSVVASTYQLSAVFTPARSPYAPSIGTVQLVVNAAPTGSEPITVGVPQSGAFIVTVTPGTVNLAVSGLTGTGTLQDVTVTDTRNYYPGWSVSGQESAFAGAGSAAGSTIPGNQLGWAPTVVGSLQGGATLGGTVAPGSPGLGSTAATLALAAPGSGFGTNVLSANVTLAIPALASAGPYDGILTLTFVEAGP